MSDQSGATPPPAVTVVVPVFNEESVLPELRRRLESALGQIDGGYDVVCVDDGSTDASAEMIADWSRSDPRVTLVELSRNFGMEIAMSAGLDHAAGEHVVLMHADLQDPPELVPEMLDAARNGADVVYARRIGRDESRIKRLMATAFYSLMQHLARVPYQGQAGDFRLMSRRVVDVVRAMPERRRFLRGMVAWVGYTQVPIEYHRAGRKGGGGASYPALFRLAFEALTSFSDVPLGLATYTGAVFAALSATVAVVMLVLTAVGTVDASIGVWILISVLFLGGVQLMSVGVLGRYLARVHEQVLQRPLYLVSRVVAGGVEREPEPAEHSRRRMAIPALRPRAAAAPLHCDQREPSAGDPLDG